MDAQRKGEVFDNPQKTVVSAIKVLYNIYIYAIKKQ